MSDTLHAKLVDIQRELKAPKDNWNDFSSFHYRSAEAILEAVKPLAHSRNLTVVCTDEPIYVGTRHYVQATAIISDGENSVKAQASAREQEVKKGMTEDQITGSASSYARKYALSGLFAIDDTKDADGHDNRESAKASESANKFYKTITPTKANATGLATAGQRKFVEDLMLQNGITDKADQTNYLIDLGVKVPLTFEGAQVAIDALKNTARQTVSV